MLSEGIIEVNYLTLIVTFIAILSGLLIILQFSRQKYENQLKALQDEALLKLKALNEKIELNHSSYETQITNLNNANRKLEEEKKLIKESFEDKLKILEKHASQINSNTIEAYEFKLSSLAKMSEAKEKQLLREFEIKEENFNEKITLLEESKKQLKIEFENLANKLFDENQKKSNLNLTQVLTSFKDQLESFGKRVNEIHNEETKQRTSLLTEIKNLKDLNNQISTDAVNLTKALKGQNKTQGDWGEMILSSILDQTGLREGNEYTIQGSFNDNDGKRLRPDVIVHLPSKKDIVIDSKVSLNAYINYCKTENEEHKATASKELVKSITSHIKALSSKKYEELDGVRTLDFVLMFIPVEGAFILATSTDDNLFKLAFENNIMLVSPSTLYVTLRTIENIWRNEHQNENALLISKKAADLYDKFASFVADIEDIGVNINRTQKAYDSAMNKLTLGNANLIKRAEEFIDLGVKPKKQISNKLINSQEE
ncbi:MAG: DNA recombination protein RmuC [Arcobacter sp.]|uniref:DNA recombination protein n=1 Tax=Arcobacter defluvii TaxID=873191 RepID=A0AAE7BED1_9BACT|nr:MULTISPECIES: DNA recombination protein RmuC [Arcobacter]QKF77548.1 DNA recombination protein [Arcobacter defluvii]RXI31701.1 DNA recombination protein RmuC [Arcobacter defluvii]BAK73355.1 DNA recombination protein RmuC-like protein [Arcobacter sp. L]